MQITGEDYRAARLAILKRDVEVLKRHHALTPEESVHLWHKIEDKILLDSPALLESLDQLRRGDTAPALTLDEEIAARGGVSWDELRASFNFSPEEEADIAARVEELKKDVRISLKLKHGNFPIADPHGATIAADQCPRCRGDNEEAYSLCAVCRARKVE